MAARWGKGRLLNIGCAHGADFVPFGESFELWGLDSSREMIKLAGGYAAKHGLTVNLVTGNAACLPLGSGSFDCAIAVAVYHHLKTEDERASGFRELRRVLKPGGEAFISVWNGEQTRFHGKGKEIMVPWKTDGCDVPRYYYLYSWLELEHAVKEAGLRVLRSFPEASYRRSERHLSKNLCVLAGRARCCFCC